MRQNQAIIAQSPSSPRLKRPPCEPCSSKEPPSVVAQAAANRNQKKKQVAKVRHATRVPHQA